MAQDDLIPHLFRTEFSKISSVLAKAFGVEHIQAAEDIASETFLAAIETWPYKGIPQSPTAWLYTVAKNKARNYLVRNQIFTQKIAADFKYSIEESAEIEFDLSQQNIDDSQLQMLFAICRPSIPIESQIGLALRILCGFGIEEIAAAFLTNKETINKRLFRAKEKLRHEGIKIEFPSDAKIANRLEVVLTTLYLLFNEGYYSETNDAVLREDLCVEAMRLTNLLCENRIINSPAANALLALMCFHSSRFAARRNSDGKLILYDDQDETLWNNELIQRGIYFLHQSTGGYTISKYHLEASIAYWHTKKEDSKEKWEHILQLYNRLLQLEYSLIAALNRTYALAKANSNREAIIEAEKLQLTNNQYYYTLLGELYKKVDPGKAMECLRKALPLAKTAADQAAIRAKLSELEGEKR